eukprot:scaffold47793_cov58-Phaeocystis_antarctica.AAC.2
MAQRSASRPPCLRTITPPSLQQGFDCTVAAARRATRLRQNAEQAAMARSTTRPRHAAGVEATMYQGHELPPGWEQAWLGAGQLEKGPRRMTLTNPNPNPNPT